MPDEYSASQAHSKLGNDLSGLGCELVQGYVFAKPSNAEEALVFARSFELESGIKALLAYSKAAADIKSIIKLAPSTAA